jgi:D-alanine-D-alanine ligase
VNAKHHVIVVYGGRSTEHEISCRSARFVASTVKLLGYKLHLVGITRQGAWFLQNSEKILNRSGVELPIEETESIEGVLIQNPSHPVAQVFLRTFQTKEKLKTPIVVFPIIHGFGGEDGSLQGILDYAEIPYVGPDLLGSAIGMDKVIAKKLVEAEGVAVVPSMVLEKASVAFDGHTLGQLRSFIKEHGFPIFVKPARLGSSVGVSKANNEQDLIKGCKNALCYDDKILLERGVVAHEIEVGVLGDADIQATIPGQVIVNSDFYSFDAKYIHKAQAHTQVPADLTQSQTDEVRQLAIRCYKALALSGMSRVDFFLEKSTQKFYFNEVNTIPGFTEISLFPLMWAKSGLGAEQLISKLLELALNRYEQRAELNRARM